MVLWGATVRAREHHSAYGTETIGFFSFLVSPT